MAQRRPAIWPSLHAPTSARRCRRLSGVSFKRSIANETRRRTRCLLPRAKRKAVAHLAPQGMVRRASRARVEHRTATMPGRPLECGADAEQARVAEGRPEERDADRKVGDETRGHR